MSVVYGFKRPSDKTHSDVVEDRNGDAQNAQEAINEGAKRLFDGDARKTRRACITSLTEVAGLGSNETSSNESNSDGGDWDFELHLVVVSSQRCFWPLTHSGGNDLH